MDLKAHLETLVAAREAAAAAAAPTRTTTDDVSSLGARLAAMHLSDDAMSLSRISDHVVSMTEDEFDAWVDGDNGLDAPSEHVRSVLAKRAPDDHHVRAVLSWIDAKRAPVGVLKNERDFDYDAFVDGDNGIAGTPGAAAAAAAPVKGWWTDFKNLFAAKLYPGSDPSVRSGVATPLLASGELTLRPSTGHTGELVVETAGGNRRYANSNNEERLVVGAPGAHAYPLPVHGLSILRNDFFRSGTESAGGKITFINPATNEAETWKLTFPSDRARALQQARVWVTDGDDLRLVLRFGAGDQPALREVVVVSKSAVGSDSGIDAKLLPADAALVDHVVQGTPFGGTVALAHPDQAHRVLGRALAALSHTYVGKVDDFGRPAPASPHQQGANTLAKFAVACHERDDESDAEDGVAARLGDAIAARIAGKLQGADKARVCAAVQSLASAVAAARIAVLRCSPAEAELRLRGFLAAPVAVRKDKVSLHATFFG